MIGFKSCRLHTVPDAALPPTLRWLILTDNRIETLPAGIGRCTGLRKLALAGNRLAACHRRWQRARRWSCCASPPTGSPPSRLAARSASAGVAGLRRQPLLRSGGAAWQAEAHTRPVPWAALATDGVLGEGVRGDPPRRWVGARGRAVGGGEALQGRGDQRRPAGHEMAACLGAGGHPQLIPVLGEVTGHPADTAGW
jgi:hypothetical protein